ncbi:hypothetical protein BJQ96_02799 [Flavobacterium sp. PL0002]|nr:hypothetical protein [Flavobacterium sp. PL002]
MSKIKRSKKEINDQKPIPYKFNFVQHIIF